MRPSGWHFRESILTAALLVASAANAHAAQNHAFRVCKIVDFRVTGTETPGASVRPTYDAETYKSEYQSKPNQNAYIESFNGRLRGECLDEHWSPSLLHARTEIETWRREYNEERPKKALVGLTPAAYAEQLK